MMHKSGAFPAKLLGFCMLLTLGVVIWMGWNSFYIHYFLTHNIAKDQEIASLADEILYLDSVYALVARQKSATGDAEFDKRYEEALGTQLDSKIAMLPD